MYNRHSNGAKTEPCGTPQVTKLNSDVSFPIETNCFLFARYEENQLYASPLTP